MKATKVILTIFLSLFSVLGNAQEKQNDASIKETISWINKVGFKTTAPLNDTLLKPKQIFFGEAVRDIFYFYETKDEESVIVVFEDKYTNMMTISSSKGAYKIYVSDLYCASNLDLSSNIEISKVDLGTINFGSNKEYALKTYKAFEHLFNLLEWNVKCENNIDNENKF